ncbi:MAG: hypothetical protein KGI57_03185, partial [Hyphomicrobiales bacterium]|nr:hypothetical protein [Hyphomicrobiales bacterium]
GDGFGPAAPGVASPASVDRGAARRILLKDGGFNAPALRGAGLVPVPTPDEATGSADLLSAAAPTAESAPAGPNSVAPLPQY